MALISFALECSPGKRTAQHALECPLPLWEGVGGGVATSTLHQHVKRLRREMTDAERKLWWKLRNRQLDEAYFRRQQPIGRYIVDFACMDRYLVVELDGGQHGENPQPDLVRDAWLASQGFCVLRFWNHEVMRNMESVLATIHHALRTPPPAPSHKGRG